ncbi:hypothetical protein [Flavobacterium caseinilyticum]|uniref:Uncharacterized protein n=1 Tax=Flavobacterium caseinilyticum TaxID=2541732 RepID=A0A4R5AYD0_9FLAO|nr:hypothetical protein [Flavobacterium caseinilyticum]TDD77139.1 hypothetical protein E0F89_05945 [Flavobacterium caseinilyticum]
MTNLKSIAAIVIFALIVICAGGWYVSNNVNKRLDKMNQDQIANQKQSIEEAKFFKFTFDQMKQYIAESEDLAEIIRNNKIKVDRIQNIQQQRLTYTDTIPFRADLQPVLAAINANNDITMPFRDSSACNPVEGTIKYINKQLSFDITKKEFKDTTTAIAYLERKKWKFLWFQTRLFGKLEGKAYLSSTCGVSETINITRVED